VYVDCVCIECSDFLINEAADTVALKYTKATDENGNTITLFTPLAPHETPNAIENICATFNESIAYGEVDPLILIPIFIHDFLCVHPFLDGNGRMSRLLTTLLLYRCGFYVGKYISLEISFAWGFLSFLIIYVIKPLFDKFILKIPNWLTYLLFALFLTDIAFTLCLKTKLKDYFIKFFK